MEVLMFSLYKDGFHFYQIEIMKRVQGSSRKFMLAVFSGRCLF